MRSIYSPTADSVVNPDPPARANVEIMLSFRLIVLDLPLTAVAYTSWPIP